MKLGPVSLFKWPFTMPNATGGKNITVIYLLASKFLDIDIRKLHETNPAHVPPHNHGTEMYRLCLHGGYDETRADGSYNSIRPGRVNHLGLHDYHRVVFLKPRTWTIGVNLKFRGVTRPSFWTDDGPVPIQRWVRDHLGLADVADNLQDLLDCPNAAPATHPA